MSDTLSVWMSARWIRETTASNEAFGLDNEYIGNRSNGLDEWILLKTVGTVACLRGAV